MTDNERTPLRLRLEEIAEYAMLSPESRATLVEAVDRIAALEAERDEKQAYIEKIAETLGVPVNITLITASDVVAKRQSAERERDDLKNNLRLVTAERDDERHAAQSAERERDEKDAALYEYESHLLAAGFATVNELRTAKESAESRLAIAVEALREIANLFGECPHDGRHDYDDDAQIAACAIQIAESAVSRIDREALAKINASQNATLPPVEE